MTSSLHVTTESDPTNNRKSRSSQQRRRLVSDLSVSGSSSLVQLLLTHGLVDQFQLWVFPLVLGAGKKLFGPGTVPAGLKLEKSQASTTGVLILDYAKAERTAAGSFALS